MRRGRRVLERYDDGSAVTPHNTNLLSPVPSAFYVGAAGAVKVRTAKGNDLSFAAVPAGTTIKLSIDRVYATGTDASSIVALFEAD